jgi:menaquinol-cytochrome c reductase iron-sulfur subunit
MERRVILKWVVRGIGATTTGAVVGPAIATLISPVMREPRGPAWQPIGPIERFEAGRMHESVVRISSAAPAETGVYVWAESADQFIVFSRACTDLACPVQWDPGSQWFLCPCHGGIFNRRGEPEAGPPAAPLYRYQTRVRAGMLEVDVFSVPLLT